MLKDLLRPGLIVSCQALEDEPLHSPKIMARLAYAAEMGGAVGIRANTGKDISAIKKRVKLPVIGLVKRNYTDSEVYITPTMKEVKEIVKAGAEIIALDATMRLRPNKLTLKELYEEIREKYPDKYLMADISTLDEGIYADELGFDIVSTTLSGFTSYTKDNKLPNIALVEALSKNLKNAILIAEGGIWTIEELNECLKYSYAAVIGSAITRPHIATRRYVEGINKEYLKEE